MELGNMIFGNSRGLYKVNRDWEKLFYSNFVDKLYEAYPDLGPFGNSGVPRFVNDTFFTTPYWWGDCTCEVEKEGIDRHYPFCMLEFPNFIHYPTGLSIQWYKYPFRDSYMNQNINYTEFYKIMQDCVNSLKIKESK